VTMLLVALAPSLIDFHGGFDDWRTAFLGDEVAVPPRQVSGVETCVSAAFGYGFEERLEDG